MKSGWGGTENSTLRNYPNESTFELAEKQKISFYLD